jgi:alpha-N-acetylglucosaminidase
LLQEPTDPLFVEVGAKFYEVLINTFGTDHVYNSDVYNEMNPQTNDSAFLAQSNFAVFSAMTATDPDAVFLMQGWLFHSGFWGPEQVQAYLSRVPNNSMIILDLNSGAQPLWQSLSNYFGHGWSWDMLHVSVVEEGERWVRDQ